MPKLPCHDAFGAATARRAKYPLRSGAYKLRETQDSIARMQATMFDIGSLLRNSSAYAPGSLLGCCTTDDKAAWLKGLPKHVADLLGYNILPAIAALTGDDIPLNNVKGELQNATADMRRLLDDCEKQHARLRKGIEHEYRSIKTGYSDLYGLLVDADCIAKRALELIDWCTMRASWTGSVAELSVWDVDDISFSLPRA